MKLHIKKGDLVYVIAGDDKGKQGKILQVLIEDKRAIVEGVNMVTKHSKPNANNTKGGRVKQEAPIHISNLMIVDPTTNKPSRIGRRKSDKTNKLVRFAKKSNKEID